MRVISRLFTFWRSLSPRVHVFIISGALLILAAAIGLYFFIRAQTTSHEAPITDDFPPVTVEHTYEDGVHTISGTITLRNRCQRFDSSSFIDDSTTPVTIRVDLTSEHDDGICLEIPETREFLIDVEAPEDAHVEVYSNGIPSSGTAL